MRLCAVLAAAAALGACTPSPGGQCTTDSDCAGGAPGSFCSAGICQGGTLATLSSPPGPFARSATLRVQISFQRVHGGAANASARLVANGVTVPGTHDAGGALYIDAPLTFAPAGVEGPVPFDVIVSDDLGHPTTLASSVLVDDLGPRISIAGAPPVDAGTVRGAVISLVVTLTDASASTLQFSLGAAPPQAAVAQPDGRFLVALDTSQAAPAAASVSAQLVATDALGNATQDIVSFPITRLRWEAQSPAPASIVGLAVTATSVLATDDEGNFISVDRSTGARTQALLPDGMRPQGSLATDGAFAYTALHGGRVCKLGLDGSVKWCCDSIDAVSSSISVGPFPSTVTGAPDVSTVIATSLKTNGRLFAMSEDAQGNCSEHASALQTSFFSASPAIAPDGTVYAPAQSAINVGRFDGFAWQEASYPLASTFSGQPAFYSASMAGQQILLSSADAAHEADSFFFPAPADGGLPAAPTEIFDAGSSLQPLSTPAIGEDGTAYVASYSQVLAIAGDGGALWQAPFSETISAAPVAGAGGVIYSVDLDGALTALGLDGGTLWTFQTDAKIVAPAAPGCDRTIYVATDVGTIFAIAADAPGLANSPWPREGHDIRGTGDARRPIRGPDGGCVE